MRRHAMLHPAVFVLLLLALCTPALAWRARTLTDYHNVRIVRTLQAESLDGAADMTRDDALAAGGRAVTLTPGGEGVNFTEQLDEGAYGIWLYARVDGAELHGPWPPVIVRMTVKKPGGETVLSRQRIAYQPLFENVARLYLVAPADGRYTVTLALDKASEHPLILDVVEVRDCFRSRRGDMPDCRLRVNKRTQNLHDRDTLDRLRTDPAELAEAEEGLARAEKALQDAQTTQSAVQARYAGKGTAESRKWIEATARQARTAAEGVAQAKATLAKIKKAAGPEITHVLAEDADADAVAELLANVRASLPPVNALLGPCDRLPKAQQDALKARRKEEGAFKPSGLYEPWALVNEQSGARYDAEGYAKGQAYTGGGVADSGNGAVIQPEDGGRPLTVTPLAEFFNARIRALVAEAQKRSLEYQRTGDPVSAREAAVLLVALAERLPTFDLRVQSSALNFGYVNYERFGQATGNPIPGVALARVYDRIIDAVAEDKALAEAVGRAIPVVRGPRDLMAFLDRNAVQYDMMQHHRFVHRTMQLGWEHRMCELLVIMGPDGDGQDWMDHFLRHTYADLTADGGYADYVLNGLHRDGSNYNGGAVYTQGSGPRLIENCILMERLADLGGDVPKYVYDPAVNPRLLEVGTFLLNWRAAGGFMMIFGDGGGAIDQRYQSGPMHPTWGPVYRWLFRHTNDARYAWLAHKVGRDPACGDAEWEAVLAAAQNQRNPILHAGTTSMPGFGSTLLELGAESDDPKQKVAVVLRHGTGKGHQHGDLLDMTLFAYNRRIVTDGGRSGWPWMRFTCQHNTLEVDRASFQNTESNSGAYGYPLVLAEMPGVRFASAGGWSTLHPTLKDFRRDTALIDLGVHETADGPVRHAYVVDCLRADGGTVHTYNVHGAQSHAIEFNVPHQPAPDAPKSLVYGAADPFTGVAADPLVTTWRRGFRTGPKGQPVKEPTGLRHHLFGLDGLRFYGAWGVHRHYNRDMPFVWIEREAEGDAQLSDAYAAVYEPFHTEPSLTQVAQLAVTGGAEGVRAPRAVQVVSRWGRTDTVLLNDAGEKVVVERPDAAPMETDAHFAILSVDAEGVASAGMVGGTYVIAGDIRFACRRGAYQGQIVSIEPGTGVLETEPALPAEADGALAALGRAPHRTAEFLRVDDGAPRLKRTLEVFRSPVRDVDEEAGVVVPAIALPGTLFDPNFYVGCTATNEPHDRFWRVEKTELASMFIPLFTPVAEADLTDADGDGRVTIKLTDFSPPEKTRDPVLMYYGPFEKPVRMKQYNRPPFEEPVVLTVTRVDADERRIYVEPPEDYMLRWHGWAYEGAVIENESGTRRWRAQVPGREFRIVLKGDEPVRKRFFRDVDAPVGGPRDGVSRIILYHVGPGDPYRVETFVSLTREGPGRLRLRANVPAVTALPPDVEVVRD